MVTYASLFLIVTNVLSEAATEALSLERQCTREHYPVAIDEAVEEYVNPTAEEHIESDDESLAEMDEGSKGTDHVKYNPP